MKQDRRDLRRGQFCDIGTERDSLIVSWLDIWMKYAQLLMSSLLESIRSIIRVDDSLRSKVAPSFASRNATRGEQMYHWISGYNGHYEMLLVVLCIDP